MTAIGSSGDLAADRLYQWALGALQDRDFEAARDLFDQTRARAPGWAPAWFGLGEALEGLERRDEAAAAFEQALRLDAADAAGAALRLARLTGAALETAPAAYVKTLFDQYAGHFDRHLVEKLGYRGPEILFEAVFSVTPPKKFDHMLDLGCGAGLAGQKFRAVAETITGVDLSPAMIFEAGKKNIYARLVAGDVLDFLTHEPADSADLALAADVFVYIGDLAAIFTAVARVLSADGLFAFTVQTAPKGRDFAVGPDLRFGHSEIYLRQCAAAAGLTVRKIAPASTRRDGGADVAGLVAVMQKTTA